ncbi:hypothetical protein [Acaryochloris sp. IP29b_bin.137]|uniref:hypothetical protein n=1 Tax=Acaryochloris sp. IP29b_bin.137 TaxID=2969217 RepID=UPI0026074CF8|nr:hypothetical protein [Acaryochloris sp. IP29b_bin.137]
MENNRILHDYETAFSQLLHPDDTSNIYAFGDVRRSPGNGDSCFYFIGQLREYLGKSGQVEHFYVPDNMGETFSNGEFNVEFAVNGRFNGRVSYGLHNLSQWPLEDQKTAGRKIYIVYWLIPDYLVQNADNSFDFRCQ